MSKLSLIGRGAPGHEAMQVRTSVRLYEPHISPFTFVMFHFLIHQFHSMGVRLPLPFAHREIPLAGDMFSDASCETQLACYDSTISDHAKTVTQRNFDSTMCDLKQILDLADAMTYIITTLGFS